MLFARPLWARAAFILSVVPLVACGSSSAPEGDGVAEYHAFANPSEAPPAVRAAAAAVVRISMPSLRGTGSFLSPDGVLLTNNHVAGVEICPREGCYATLAFGHERGSASDRNVDVFLVPLHVDVGLDMAVLQAYDAANHGQKLATPAYLGFAPVDAAALEGTSVHVVGHPQGKLKKWSTGDAYDADGTWFRTTAFSLPGSSGSPFLNDDGRIVGLLHRGSSGEDVVTEDGLDAFSIGSASAPLVAALAAPLPSTVRSIASEDTDESALSHRQLYYDARVDTAIVGGVPKRMIDLLATACDAALTKGDVASPEDLDALLAPCVDAIDWIECVPANRTAPQSCPTGAVNDAWAKRFTEVAERYRALNGNLWLDGATFAPQHLQTTTEAARQAGESALVGLLNEANAPVDLSVAPYVASLGLRELRGVDLVALTKGYKKVAHYERSALSIAYTALWLSQFEALDRTSTLDVLHTLADDPAVSLGTKLYIEEVRYNSHDLD